MPTLQQFLLLDCTNIAQNLGGGAIELLTSYAEVIKKKIQTCKFFGEKKTYRTEYHLPDYYTYVLASVVTYIGLMSKVTPEEKLWEFYPLVPMCMENPAGSLDPWQYKITTSSAI